MHNQGSVCYDDYAEVFQVSKILKKDGDDQLDDASERHSLLGGDNLGARQSTSMWKSNAFFWVMSQLSAFLMLAAILLYFHVAHKNHPPVCQK